MYGGEAGPGLTAAFFSNLLPESGLLAELVSASGADSLYDVLAVYGRECAGALSVCPEGQEPPEPDGGYVDITDRLEKILDRSGGRPERSLILGTGARLSIAGGQNKLPALVRSGRILLPEPGSWAPTNAVLKAQHPVCPGLHRNEMYCMRLVAGIGLPAAECTLMRVSRWEMYITRRYDREESGGRIRRIHQEDFCQALGVLPDRKYEALGGPGFRQCIDLMYRSGMESLSEALKNFLKCAVFNCIIGNGDAHAKNFSLLCNNGAVRLAPFYDLVCTRAYRWLSSGMAMRWGQPPAHDDDPLGAWQEMASACRVGKDAMRGIIENVSAAVRASFQDVASDEISRWGDFTYTGPDGKPESIYGIISDVIKNSPARLEKALDPPLSGVRRGQDADEAPSPL